MVDASTSALGHTGVAAAFGLVIAVMIVATGHISGAHFNPAVTVAFASIGHFSWRQVPAYLASQVAAAILGALLLRVLLGPVAELGVTQASGGLAVAIATEVVFTFLLMFVIAAVATDRRAPRSLAGIAIGGTVGLAALVGGPLSGASLNPARSLGPALVSGCHDDLWLYLTVPFVAAVAGALAYRALAHSDEGLEP